MCGRFVLVTPAKSIAERFDLEEFVDVEPRYNVAPTQDVGIIRVNPQTGGRNMRMAKWGLIPSWAKDPSIGPKLINARSETVHQKPAFRTSFKARRCLVPSDGFYEWDKLGKVRQPYLFRMADGNPFAFAGLWDRWTAPDGTVTETCTVLTTPANDRLIAIHDRMPAILQPEDYGTWLDSALKDPEVLLKLLVPFPSERMVGQPVSRKVNRASYEAPDCIEPINIEETGS